MEKAVDQEGRWSVGGWRGYELSFFFSLFHFLFLRSLFPFFFFVVRRDMEKGVVGVRSISL